MDESDRVDYHRLNMKDLKAQLMGEGRWADFVKFRNKYKMAGMGNQASRREALTELLLKPIADYVQAPPVPLSVEEEKLVDLGVTIPKPKAKDRSKRVDPKTWSRRKSVSPQEEIFWAVKHVKAWGIKPKDAPGMLAWTLLLQMREDEEFYMRMLREVSLKTISKKPEEEGPEEEVFPEKDLLEQIELVKEEAVAAREANPEEGEGDAL